MGRRSRRSRRVPRRSMRRRRSALS
jgi:hypothetical protein